MMSYLFQSLHQEPKTFHVLCWSTKFSLILLYTREWWNGMSTCGDNSRKRLLEKNFNKKSGDFPVYNRDCLSWCGRAGCWCWGCCGTAQSLSWVVVEKVFWTEQLRHMGWTAWFMSEILVWTFESWKQICLRYVEYTDALNLYL